MPTSQDNSPSRSASSAKLSLAKSGDDSPLTPSFGDCRATRNSLEIFSEAGFYTAGAALAAWDETSQWLWGDYLLFAEKYDLKTVLDQADKNLHRSTLYAHKEVSRFFPPTSRRRELTFTHHREIRYILGADATLKDAKVWLNRAAENGWSCGELREAMRKSQRAEEQDPGPMRGVVSFADIAKVTRWAETIADVREIPEAQVIELRETTKPLWHLMNKIHGATFS